MFPSGKNTEAVSSLVGAADESSLHGSAESHATLAKTSVYTHDFDPLLIISRISAIIYFLKIELTI